MLGVQFGAEEVAGENMSHGGNTRVVRRVLDGKGRKYGFAIGKEHRNCRGSLEVR